MEEHDEDLIIMLDKERKYLGVVVLDEAIEAKKETDKDIREVIRDDVLHKTSPDAYINELLPYAGDSKHPIVVLDENNVFKGIVTRATIIKNLY